jgi:uncharacterized protein (DUF779 family)
MATGFRERRPKAVVNAVGAVAVGVVAGAYGMSPAVSRAVVRAFHHTDFIGDVVPHSNGFRKLEIGQLKTVVASVLAQSN